MALSLEDEATRDLIKYGLIVGGVLVAAYFVYNQFFNNPNNQGDPGGGLLLGNTLMPGGENADYAGYGLLGTLGATVNTLLFDVPDWIGSKIGGSIPVGGDTSGSNNSDMGGSDFGLTDSSDSWGD